MSRVLVFGEILWDVYGSDKKIGGAPFNFAAHSAALGASVDIVSAIGDDELGQEARKELDKRSVGGKYLAVVPYKTGYCSVTTGEDGNPHYDLVANVAYDHIPLPNISGEYDALYFGSLAMRSEESEKTLLQLLKKKFNTVFYDINVRKPHFRKDAALAMIANADILKLSREEAPEISADYCGEKLCRLLMAEYPQLRAVIMTLDKDGAMLCLKNGETFYSKKTEIKPVSTVGAGDSFSAAFMSGVLDGNTPARCLEKASTLAGYVITQIGAVPELTKELLKELKKI